jgi:uncharacterized UPF0160 family protein
MKIVTHNGSFHADEVFAIGALTSLEKFKDAEIVRTRDEEIIKTGDLMVDVGRGNDEEKNFDHHQLGGAGKRENGIPYASFGLIWKKFGEEICQNKNVSESLDKKLVQPIDAWDNGLAISKEKFEEVSEYTISDFIESFMPSWKERDFDKGFNLAIEQAKKLLLREITRLKDAEEAKKIVEDVYKKTQDKRIIVLENYMPWLETLIQHDEPLFAVYPGGDNDWRVQTVKTKLQSYDSRKDLPLPWAGKSGSELAEVTGVSDVIFCHNGRFIAAAKTKEGAIKLAHLALEAN